MAQDLDELLPAFVMADPSAFEEWVARAEPALRRSLASFAAHADVEAVLQETLLRIWQIAPRFRPDGLSNGSLRLARRVARNLAIDAVRRDAGGGRLVDAGEESPELAIEPVEPDPFLRAAVARCHEAMTGRPRAALDARVASGGRSADSALAAGLGMRLNTFLQNVTRARQLLSDCLAQHGIALDEVWR